MLNCTEYSQAKKTAGIAQTYRAGKKDIYSTCPDRCPLKPYETGTTEIDRVYESALRKAVPRRGVSFLFTHFLPENWAEKNAPNKTVFNFSADNLKQAAKYIKKCVASVAIVKVDYWEKKTSNKVTYEDGVRFVRCPDETMRTGCVNCGGGVPLCARHDRDYGIVFTAHGFAKNKASNPDKRGGCYGGGGKVAYHWRNLIKRQQIETDAEKLKTFVKKLRPRSIFRPHIVGDMGKPI